MSQNAARHLVDLHDSLYRRAFQTAQKHASLAAPGMQEKAQKFREMLPEKFTLTQALEVEQSIFSSDITLVGDFHTLRQSQREFLRILRTITAQNKERPIIIALEMFRARDQKYVDQFLTNQISETEFLEKINYVKTWGFSWRNYEPIVDFAKQHKIPVVAINVNKTRATKDIDRDAAIAENIIGIKKANPSSLVLTLIGEIHLADDFLPRALSSIAESELRLCRIVSNVDQYYFELLNLENSPITSGAINLTEWLCLRPNLYCVINTPPWIKWQSFAHWEELIEAHHQNLRALLIERHAPFQDDEIDVDHVFADLTQHLAHFLRLPLPHEKIHSFTIFSDFDASMYQSVRRKLNWNKTDVTSFIERIDRDGFGVLEAPLNWIIIPDISMNRLARAAGEFLRTIFSPRSEKKRHSQVEKFLNSVVTAIASTLSLAILNPKHQNWRNNARNSTHSESIINFEAWLRIQSNAILAGENVNDEILRKLARSDQQRGRRMSSAIGGYYGKMIYESFIRNQRTLEQIQPIFYGDSYSQEFTKRLLINLLVR